MQLEICKSGLQTPYKQIGLSSITTYQIDGLCQSFCTLLPVDSSYNVEARLYYNELNCMKIAKLVDDVRVSVCYIEAKNGLYAKSTTVLEIIEFLQPAATARLFTASSLAIITTAHPVSHPVERLAEPSCTAANDQATAIDQ